MREILFRGRRMDNGEWVWGDLRRDKWKESNFIDTFIGEWRQRYAVDTSTIGQYTGLTDRNGTKIFEHDLLEFLNDDGDTSLYAVSWGGKVAGWVITGQDRYSVTDTMADWDPKRWTVAGDIWDGVKEDNT